VKGDAEEEEESEEEMEGGGQAKEKVSDLRGKKRKSNAEIENGEDHLDQLGSNSGHSMTTPLRRRPQASSSPFPFDPPSSAKDYSSELDFSSPPDLMSNWINKDDDDDDDDDDENEEDENTPSRPGGNRKRGGRGEEGKGSKKQRTNRPERTRVYEVVAVVRRKVVFALRYVCMMPDWTEHFADTLVPSQL
jgi:hypothetical protein